MTVSCAWWAIMMCHLHVKALLTGTSTMVRKSLSLIPCGTQKTQIAQQELHALQIHKNVSPSTKQNYYYMMPNAHKILTTYARNINDVRAGILLAS